MEEPVEGDMLGPGEGARARLRQSSYFPWLVTWASHWGLGEGACFGGVGR